MSQFIQLHLLTAYPPSNLNRDDLGKPKSAVIGGAPRLRISSQSLKRAWRTSDLFASVLGSTGNLNKNGNAWERILRTPTGNIGIRTKTLGVVIYERMIEGGVPETRAFDVAHGVASSFGSLPAKENGKKKKKETGNKNGEPKDKKKGLTSEQTFFLSPTEIQGVIDLVEQVVATKHTPESERFQLLRKQHSSVDIAMFGRMFTNPKKKKDPKGDESDEEEDLEAGKNTKGKQSTRIEKSMEAAVQVAHAITVHRVQIEDDFFTAVDDLNSGEDDAGAAHLGETEFAAGVFYLYLCINETLLVENLGGDKALAKKAVQALVEAATQVSPTGKVNSFAHHSLALFALAEVGSFQPRNLSFSYLTPVEPKLDKAINALDSTKEKLDQAYNQTWESYRFSPMEGQGSLKGLTDFLGEDHA